MKYFTNNIKSDTLVYTGIYVKTFLTHFDNKLI